MASVSSLLSSAQATQSKIQSANDAEVAYEWSQSAQTYDDYLAYQSYLTGAASSTTDPTKQLSYTTKLSDAFSSYATNEIQRQSEAVAEGQSTLQDKMDTVSGLYSQAASLGNENLAQNLRSTWDSLSVEAQNQATAAASASTAATTAADTALKNQVSDYKDQLSQVTDAFTKAFTAGETPQEQKANIAALNAQLPANLQIPEGSTVFDVAASVSQQMSQIYQQAIAQAGDDSTVRTLQGELNDYQTGTVLKLPSVNGGSINLTADDVSKQLAANNVGQNMFTTVNTANGQAFVQNKINNYEFGHDANGNVVALPTYSQSGMNLSGTVTDSNGKPINVTDAAGKTSQATYDALLKQAGFSVTNSNGSYIVQDTTGKNRLDGQDSAQVYQDSSGHLQFANNDNQIYNLEFDGNGKFVKAGQQTANPFLTQYSAGSRGADTPYFEAHQDQAAEAIGTAGLLTPQTIAQFNKSVGVNKNPILNSPQITPNALPQFSATQVLQGAANLQARTASLQAPQVVTAPGPQLQSPNIAQAIQSNAPATISIAKPTAPQPAITNLGYKGPSTSVGISGKAPTFNIGF